MNASFRTAFWAMCLGLTVPMVLFVGVELTSGGRAARKSIVSAADYGVSLRAQWKTNEAKLAARDLPALAAPGSDNPNAGRPTRAVGAPATIVSRPQNEKSPRKKPVLDPPDAAVVLGPQLETEPSGSEPEMGHDHRVPAHVTGARPRVEILPDPEPSAIEARLASIQQNLDRLARVIDAQSQPGTAAGGRRMPLYETGEKPTKRQPLTKIYRPRYLSASALQSLVEPLLTSKIGKAGAADAGTEESALAAGGGLSPAASSILVVHDYPAVLRKIDRLVLELDVPPVALVIEATVLTVRLNGDMPYGIDLQEFNSPGQPFFVSAVDGMASAAHMTSGRTPLEDAKTPPIGEGPLLTHGFGLKCGVLEGDPREFLSVLQAAAQTRFVRAWQMNVLNRQSAQLMLNDPFGPGGSACQAAAGTILKIRPIIIRSGLIHLDVRREVDLDAVVSGTRAAALTNQFVLHNGQTAIVGGYYAEHLAAQFYRPPGIVQMPLPAKPFRRQSGAVERSETIVLLTPHIGRLKSSGRVAEPAQISDRPILKDTAGGLAIDAPKQDEEARAAAKQSDSPPWEEPSAELLPSPDPLPAEPAPPQEPPAKPPSAHVPPPEPPRRLPEELPSKPIIRPAREK